MEYTDSVVSGCSDWQTPQNSSARVLSDQVQHGQAHVSAVDDGVEDSTGAVSAACVRFSLSIAASFIAILFMAAM